MKTEDRFYEVAAQIDDILASDFTKTNADNLLTIIKKHSSYEDYFFKNVQAVEWFNLLKDEEYFSMPQWKVLAYLENISKQTNIADNEKYIGELLAIINDVSTSINTSSERIDNYRIWWYFVKILLNIPNEKIPLEIINLIPIWLGFKFDTVLQGSDIATKLLPKFISTNPTKDDIQKAEMIIDYITALRIIPLKEEESSVFSENRNIRLVIKPYYLQEAFNKYSVIIGKECSRKVIDNLVTKIKMLLKRENALIDLDIESELYYLVLLELDTKYVIRLASGKWTSLSEMVKVISSDPKNPNVVTELVIDKCNKIDFVENVFKELKENEILTKLDPNVLRKSIKNMYCSFYDKETYHSFYEESDYTFNDPLRLLTFILKKILTSKSTNDVKESDAILKGFLEDKFIYFQKMAIYVIGQNAEAHDDMFWEILDKDIGYDILQENIYFGDELKHLLQNLVNLTETQREKLKDMIEAGPKYYVDDDDSKKYLSHWKQRRYQALIHDPYFKNLYEINKKISETDAELRPAIGKVEVRRVYERSPLEKEDLLAMNNREIVDYLSNFKAKDSMTGPNADGLANYLKEIAKEQPEKFTGDFSPFLKTGFFYIYRIIWGIRDAWNNKKSVEWDKLLDFIKEYINRDEFWNNEYNIEDSQRNANHEWVLGMIGELIQDGTKDDNWAFEGRLLPKAQEILLLIVDKLKTEEETEIADTVTHALNSTFGKIITALIYLALRIARLEDKEGKKKEIKWSSELKNKYEKVLVDGVIEAYTLFGRYMANLLYLDMCWVEKKIKDFEKIEKEHLWSAFMEGYLFPGNVYNETYKEMRKHYSKGITYSFKDEHIEERLIEHVAVGYLRGVEAISNNSLFDIVLNKRKPTQLKVIIRFFWSRRNSYIKTTDRDISDKDSSENEKIRKRIIEFWKWLYKEYKEKDSLNEDDKEILSTVTILAEYLPQIDTENFKWLMLSAPYVFNDYDSSHFIECLDRLKDKGSKIETARHIAKIFQEMLEKFTPDYNQEDVESIVEYLYKVNDKETIYSANIICNVYGSRGNDLLREIYEKYNDV